MAHIKKKSLLTSLVALLYEPLEMQLRFYILAMQWNCILIITSLDNLFKSDLYLRHTSER